MRTRKGALLALALTSLAVVRHETCAQSIYTPYAFTNFVGSPTVSGTNDGTGSAAQFNEPQGLALDAGGNLYVADELNGTVRKITPAGVVTTLAGGFNKPTGLAVDGAGNLYVGNTYNHTIDQITPAGVVTTLAGTAGTQGSDDGTNSAALFKYPTGVAVDSATNLYVADYLNARIRKITPSGTNWVVTTLAGLSGEFQYPDGVAVDNAGNVYVADEGIQTIQKITPGGAVSTFAGSAGQCGSSDGTNSAALFCRPHGVVVDSAGNLFVADYFTNTIRKITVTGTDRVVTTLAGNPGPCGGVDGIGSAAGFCGPNGVAVDSTGHLYVADGLNNRISKGAPSTLTINRQITNIVHHFSPPAFLDPGYVTDEIMFDTAGLVNVDLSQYMTFELRLFTPAGQRIVVNPPTNFTSQLWVYYLTNSDTGSHFAPPATLSFENFSGVLPTRTYSLFYIGDAGNVLEFVGYESYTNSVEFTAMKYAFTPAYNPPNTSKTFQERSDSSIPVYFNYTTSHTNDPGPFVTLTAVSPLMAMVQGTPGNVNISWLSKLNVHYQVQYVTSLINSNWMNAGNEIIGNGLTKSFSDSTTNGPARYYRIKVPP